jgi:uncharacterized membrane protein (UPF0182 family)
MAGAVALNGYIAYRLRPVYRPMNVEQQSLERYREAIDPVRTWTLVGLSALLGLMAAGSAAAEWQTFLTWWRRTPFGVDDPQFSRDVGFYAFEYPWYRFLVSFLFAVVVLSLAVAVVTHYVYGAIRLQSAGERVSPPAQAHLSVLLGLFLLLKAIAYYLDRYGLILEDNSLFTGGSYTDINAQLPAKTILAIIALVCAVLFFANAWRRSWTLPLLGVGLMALSAVLLSGIWPAFVQQFQVRPSEPDRERDFIARNMEATRAAYGIDSETVQIAEYAAATEASAGQLRDDAETVPGIRLLDPNIVSPTFQQLQQVRGFYTFPDPLDVGRYDINGLVRDVVVATREIDINGIPDAQKNWINQHTVYTHGYGFVAAFGNQRNADGSPVWAEEDIPPVGELGEYEPRIYFGENSPEYSIVGAPEGTEPVEFDIPEDAEAGGAQRNNTYAGEGGVPVGSLVNKLLYATKFQEGNILLSNRINEESRILYDRHPRERVAKVAPWLHVDGDPYPAVVGGRVLWILDGYTSIDTYPYAQRIGLEAATLDSRTQQTSVVAQPQLDVNYIRNSVKATVDAYDGTVTLYAWDENDPVLATWMKIYPDTVEPRSEISQDLIEHLRYPEDLFKVQRNLLARYHVSDPLIFYGGQDNWKVPFDPTVNEQVPQPPYYLTLQMPDQESPVFSLTSTFTPRNRENLAAFMAVDADARSDDYGTIRVLRLPGSTQVDGPAQVANTFESNAAVAQATLPLRQSGADTIEGNLLTLPVGGGLLYVQPYYVERRSGDASFPLLRLVVVSFGSRVGVAETLQEALDQVFQGDAGTDTGEGGVPEEPPAEGEPQPTETLADVLARAQTAFADAEAAAREGRWAEYGEAIERLQAALDEAAGLAGETSAPTPTPAATAEPTPSP